MQQLGILLIRIVYSIDARSLVEKLIDQYGKHLF